jgi:hypothetical protein
MQPEFNVDKIGYRPHDAHIGERGFLSYGGYRYLLKRFGVHNISTEQILRATKPTDDDAWGWNWYTNLNIEFYRYHRITLWHEDWYFRFQQEGYRGGTTGLGYTLSAMRIFDYNRIALWTEEQYDWDDDYFGRINVLSLAQRLKVLENLALNYDSEIVWEYFPNGELDEVKRVANIRLTYLPTRDIFIRVFAPINITERQYGVNALISYAYHPMSRLYLAYNERRIKDDSSSLMDRIIMVKISYLWNL